MNKKQQLKKKVQQKLCARVTVHITARVVFSDVNCYSPSSGLVDGPFRGSSRLLSAGGILLDTSSTNKQTNSGISTQVSAGSCWESMAWPSESVIVFAKD